MNPTSPSQAPAVIVEWSAAAFEAALPALCAMLQTCVAGGASIGWPTPPAQAVADRFWRQCADDAAAGGRMFWLALERAEDPASVIGTAQLVLSTPPNGQHRADVVKVMVHPRARRQGLAARLMQRAEDEARARGRSLLVLDTLKGCDAERLYPRLGYQISGRIPSYALIGDGTLEATTVMFKRLHASGLQLRLDAHDSPDALALRRALSAQLMQAYGSDGESGFAGFSPDTGAFVVARDAAGRPVGCGAVLALPARGPRCAEIKRMHAAQPRRGIGRAVLQFLEHEACLLGHREVAVSTRRANKAAVSFYRQHGFEPIEAFGAYVDRPDSICLGKAL
jgi:GNAT superfamily N-acetyltransferase